MLKRVMLTLAMLVVAGTLLVSAALWFALARWVPEQGKALLIERLEQQWPIQADIAGMRYSFLQGLVLEDFKAQDPSTREMLLEASTLRAHINWLELAFTRRLGFRIRGELAVPCVTSLAITGRYNWQTRELALRAVSENIALDTISGPWARQMPAALLDGTFRADVRYMAGPVTLPVITGRVMGSALMWKQGQLQLRGDVIMEGSLRRQRGAVPWGLELDAELSNAALQGLSQMGAVSDINGRFHITEAQVDIVQLRAQVLGEPWKAEGTMPLKPHPSIEAHAQGRASLAALSLLAAAWVPDARAEGDADIDLVCRGPLQPTPFFDCLTQAELHDASIYHARLVYPLTKVNGPLRYDALTREVSLPELRGAVRDALFTLDGNLQLRPPAQIDAHFHGTLPLEMVMPWLPESSPVAQLSGTAVVDLAAEGPLARLRYAGDVQLRDTSLALERPALSVTQGSATLDIAPGEFTLTQSHLILNGQPLSLQGQWIPGNHSRVQAIATFAQGTLALNGRLTDTHMLLDFSQLNLQDTALKMQGALAREAHGSSRLQVSGTVEVAELARLPFVHWEKLAEWQAQGRVAVDGRFDGSLTSWQAGAMQAKLRSEALFVRQVPLQQVLIAAEQEGGMLRVDIPAALLADGKLVGELTLDHRRSPGIFLAQADLVNLKLARLSQAIPAWRGRDVSGEASLHIVMGGRWGQRHTWEGEGWVNANGRQLGSVRLLEKLFAGIFGVMGDQLGLDMLRRAEVTQVSASWRLNQERFSTDDLRLGALAGTEPVALYGKGSVGFDQTLDFIIDPELSEATLLQAPTTSSLVGVVLKAAGKLETLRRLVGRHRLTGTIKNPNYRFEVGRQELLNEVDPTNPAGLLQDIIKSIR